MKSTIQISHRGFWATALIAGAILLTILTFHRSDSDVSPPRNAPSESSGQLFAQLRDTDPEIRAQAAKKLGQLNDSSMAPHLVQALIDPHFRVPPAAHRSLVSMGSNAIPALLDGLKSGHLGLWQGSSFALEKIGEPAVGPLLHLWTNSDLGTRFHIEWTLKQLRAELASSTAHDSIPRVTPADKDPQVGEPRMPKPRRYVEFCFPCVTTGGLVLALKDDAVRALWRYSMRHQKLQKICDLPIRYSINDLQIANPDEYAYHEMTATEDGAFIYIQIDFNNTVGNNVLHAPDRYFVLNTATKEWTEIFKGDSVVRGAYIIPGTHTLVFLRNYNSNGGRSSFGKYEFDSARMATLFDFPNDGQFFYSHPVIVSEKNTQFVIFDANIIGVPLVAFWSLTERGLIAQLGRPGMGELQYCSPRFFSSDGKYAATARCVLELVGSDIQTRLMHIPDGRKIVTLEALSQECIGWNVADTLVAFRGLSSAVGTSPSGERTVYADYVPEKASEGEIIKRLPSLAVYDRQGKQLLNYREDPWQQISFARWYDDGSILFQVGNEVKLIGVTNSSVHSVIVGITTKTSKE